MEGDDRRTAGATLEYRGDSIALRGEILIGRGLACRLRFNDPTVSRRHVRLMASPAGVTAEDLGSTNGTKVNDRTISGVHHLADGDTLQIGNRSLNVRVVTEHADDGGIDEPRIDPLDMPTLQTCPRCRATVSIEDEVCGECGHRWPPGRPLSGTVKIPVSSDRRRDPRFMVDIPGLYTSPSITCDATAANLSRGGVLVLTELVDEVDMPCQIFLLPDGTPATTIAGVVRRVLAATGNGHVSGMAIQFVGVDQATAARLESILYG